MTELQSSFFWTSSLLLCDSYSSFHFFAYVKILRWRERDVTIFLREKRSPVKNRSTNFGQIYILAAKVSETLYRFLINGFSTPRRPDIFLSIRNFFSCGGHMTGRQLSLMKKHRTSQWDRKFFKLGDAPCFIYLFHSSILCFRKHSQMWIKLVRSALNAAEFFPFISDMLGNKLRYE